MLLNIIKIFLTGTKHAQLLGFNFSLGVLPAVSDGAMNGGAAFNQPTATEVFSQSAVNVTVFDNNFFFEDWVGNDGQNLDQGVAQTLAADVTSNGETYAAGTSFHADLPPEAPSFIMRVCGFGFHILHRHFGQARRVQSPQFAPALGALVQAFGSPAMNAV